MNILPLVQQQHGSQVAYSLIGELLRCNQLQALQLQNVCGQFILVFPKQAWACAQTFAKLNALTDTRGEGLPAYLPKVRWVAQHVHIEELSHIPAAVSVVLLSEGRADGGALLLDHLALLRLGTGCPDGPDQLPQSDRSGHSLEDTGGRVRTHRALVMWAEGR